MRRTGAGASGGGGGGSLRAGKGPFIARTVVEYRVHNIFYALQ